MLLALEQDRKETKFQAACLSKFTKDWTDDTYLCWRCDCSYYPPELQVPPHKFEQIVSFSRAPSQAGRSGSWNPASGLPSKLWSPAWGWVSLEDQTPGNCFPKREHTCPDQSAWRRFLLATYPPRLSIFSNSHEVTLCVSHCRACHFVSQAFAPYSHYLYPHFTVVLWIDFFSKSSWKLIIV